MEYRGYDSAGVVVLNEPPRLVKSVGRIANLEKKLDHITLHGNAGIAHTRWATHGKPSETNAHPHTDCRAGVFLAHNGIIENYQVLKQNLLHEGHVFKSETDTETIAHLIEKYYAGDLEDAVKHALALLEGTFGLAICHADHPDQVILARRSSPIILGVGLDELFAASDVAALIRHTKRVVYLDDNEVAVLTQRGFHITTLDNRFIRKTIETVDWDIGAAEKQGFPHFMLKEIFEQPESVQNAFRGRLLPAQGTAKLGGLETVVDELQKMQRMVIVSCGTSYYAGLVGRYMLEELTNMAVEVDLASEFRYRTLNHLRQGAAVIAISQSGETADSLAAIQAAKEQGAMVLGLVNVVGSTISRETQAGVYTHSGPEIGVAATKSFTSQITVLALISLMLGRLQEKLDEDKGKEIIAGLERLPEQISQILSGADRIKEMAEKYAGFQNFLYLGRKYHYPIALEGALKLKEIAYIHSEGYAAGEMKHGPIALIDPSFPTVCIAVRDNSYAKILSNIEEIKARDGKVLAVATEGDEKIRQLVDDVIYVPENQEILMPVLTVVPMQLLAYYIANAKGCEIDKPRNLAKSVTVE
jgi:glucosamine--fructose-6-phosphate aminotransferase (isomerizing)